VRRTAARLLDLALAVALSVALASVPQAHAAAWPDIPASDALWPMASLGEPQWVLDCPRELALGRREASIRAGQ
jgi:hypothetical protein